MIYFRGPPAPAIAGSGETFRGHWQPDFREPLGLALLQAHVAKDDLIAWGWNPGAGRDPVPGTQELAGQLMQAWQLRRVEDFSDGNG